MDFEEFHKDFKHILGTDPKAELLLEKNYAFAHEAGVFLQREQELFITSNRLFDTKGHQYVEITKVRLNDNKEKVRAEVIPCEEIQMGNGGVNYRDGILFCAQGSEDAPSGLYYMSSHPPYQTSPVVTAFYTRSFNSVNDVVVANDGCIWFTDPSYGYKQGYRPKPVLPNQVYRYNPVGKDIRAVADGFGRPNGICFSPDETIVYITDTYCVRGDGTTDYARAATIYAFDVAVYSGQPFLINKRLFAMCDNGVPDGIKCDMNGNVYSGCGDGLHVWSPGGVLLGKMLVAGGVANFCFGEPGCLYLLNETRLWRVSIDSRVRGALLKL